jgi:hypothetical protein
LVSKNGQSLVFQLTGAMSGQLNNGNMVSGTTTQMFHTSVAQLAQGIVHITSGSTHLTAVPEPGTMGLLATGLVGLARMARSKLLLR